MEVDSDTNNDSMDLLEKAQKMVEIEQSLTSTLEKVEPWLLSATTTNIDPNRPRVRPIPQTMEQVKSILCVARNLASRTSAPAAWNPNAPVVGFSTPNPLPHQLRGGALAALQLDRARQEERDRKRQRVEEEQQKEKSKHAHNKDAAGSQGGAHKGEGGARGGGDQQQHRAADARRQARGTGEAHGRRQAQQQQQQQMATMNLSDSSSEEESDED